VVRGGTGDDLVYGQSENDTVWGGRGVDRLSGGGGTDRFLFQITPSFHDGQDTIVDFRRGELDKLVFVNAALTALPIADLLDTSGDRLLSAADTTCTVRDVTIDGVARSSLVIDVGSVISGVGTGVATVTLYGVDRIALSDILTTGSFV
jgi:Ca2+-binding RTX toxin-like protein